MADMLTVITNGKRPELLRSTLLQLDREGAEDRANYGELVRCLFFDGGYSPLAEWAAGSGWRVFHRQGPNGTRSCMRWVMRTFVESGCRRLLYAEDDLAVAEDAVNRMLDHTVGEHLAFTNFSDWHTFPIQVLPGKYLIPAMGHDGTGLWGTQCFLMNRHVVEYLSARTDEEWSSWQHPVPEHRDPVNSADTTMVYLLSKSAWPFYELMIPTEIGHAGIKQSTISVGHDMSHGREHNFRGVRR